MKTAPRSSNCADMPNLSRRTFILAMGTSVGTFPLARRAHGRGPKILVLGGSTMGGALGKYLETALSQVGYAVHRRAKGSSGLARPDFFDWPTQAQRLHSHHQPAATVVMFGGNDGQGLWMGKNASPPWIRWQDPGWGAEYARRVDALVKILSPGREHVFWVGMPAMRSPRLNRRIQKMNGIYQTQMARHADAHFLDMVPVLGTKAGGYTEHILVDGKKTKVRADDGVHLSMKGAKVVVNHVVPGVREKISLA